MSRDNPDNPGIIQGIPINPRKNLFTWFPGIPWRIPGIPRIILEILGGSRDELFNIFSKTAPYFSQRRPKHSSRDRINSLDDEDDPPEFKSHL